MKIHGGAMWQQMKNSRKPWAYLRFPLIAPGLAGVFASFQFVWAVGWHWTTLPTVSITFAIIAVMIYVTCRAVIEDVRHHGVLDCERVTMALASLFAAFVGVVAVLPRLAHAVEEAL